MLLRILRVSPSGSENSPHTTRHALQQCPQSYRPNCLPRLVDSLDGTIHLLDLDWHWISDIFYWVHVWTISWPARDLGAMLVQCGGAFSQTEGFIRKHISFMVACDPSESGCSDACSSFCPAWPGCSSIHDGLHPRQWLMSRYFQELTKCRHRSVSRLVFSALEPYYHYGIGKTWTHHWRCSVSSDEGPLHGASVPTHDDVAGAPNPC